MRKLQKQETFPIYRLLPTHSRVKQIRNIWMNPDIANLQMQFMRNLPVRNTIKVEEVRFRQEK